MANVAQHNRRQHNRGALAATVTQAAQHPILAYKLTVHEASGAMVASLNQWSKGNWDGAINTPDVLTFEYPYSATAWDYFAFPRQIWLWNDRGVILDKFHIIKRKRTKSLDGNAVIEVSGNDLLYQLSREIITNYYTGNAIQTLTVDATGGTFTATFRGQTTAALAYNVSAADLQTALTGLSTIGSGNLTVAGNAGGPFTMTYQGALSETDVPVPTFDCASLTGGGQQITASISRIAGTVRGAIATWLGAYQQNVNPIYFGSVDSLMGDQTIAVKMENKSILTAIQELLASYGGYIWVEPSTRLFYWMVRQGSTTGQYVRIGKNGQNLEQEEDYSGIATQVIATGQGSGINAQIQTTANSDNQGTYGVIPFVAANKNIWTAAELAAYAQATVDAMKVPVTNWQLGVIDLARLTAADYSFHDLAQGSHIRVIDVEFGLAIDTTISRIVRNLDSPLDIKIEVSNPNAGTTAWGGNSPLLNNATQRSIEDTIADLYKIAQQQLSDTGVSQTLSSTLPQLLIQPTDIGKPVTDALQNALNKMIGAGSVKVPLPGANIQSVGIANTAGSSSAYARDDHIHKGPHFSASAVANIDTTTTGTDWVTTGTDKRAYVVVDSAILGKSHL